MVNLGVAFGLFPNMSVWLLVLILIGLVIYAGKMRELWGKIGVGIIVIGGVGNLVSRLKYGGVVDNWSLLGLVYNNWADYLIFVGVIIYGYTYFIRRQRDRRDRQAKRNSM